MTQSPSEDIILEPGDPGYVPPGDQPEGVPIQQAPVPPEQGGPAPAAEPPAPPEDLRPTTGMELEFAEVMQLTRRARLRQGALSWGLFRDASTPGRYVEYFVDESWWEHQRRLERFTAGDAGLRERRLGFHIGPQPPAVRRLVGESLLD